MPDRSPRRVHVLDRPLRCSACRGETFYAREIKMQTTGMTFFDLDAFNESAEGVVCTRCGFVHLFAARVHEWLDVDGASGPSEWADHSDGGKDPRFRDLS